MHIFLNLAQPQVHCFCIDGVRVFHSLARSSTCKTTHQMTHKKWWFSKAENKSYRNKLFGIANCRESNCRPPYVSANAMTTRPWRPPLFLAYLIKILLRLILVFVLVFLSQKYTNFKSLLLFYMNVESISFHHILIFFFLLLNFVFLSFKWHYNHNILFYNHTSKNLGLKRSPVLTTILKPVLSRS